MTGSAHLADQPRTGGATRVDLLPRACGPHRLDGTWWPRSRDFRRELPALITALEDRWPGITRVTVSPSAWRVRPGSLLLDDRTVHINWSDSGSQAQRISLLSYGVGRCDLLVEAPGAASAASGTE